MGARRGYRRDGRDVRDFALCISRPRRPKGGDFSGHALIGSFCDPKWSQANGIRPQRCRFSLPTKGNLSPECSPKSPCATLQRVARPPTCQSAPKAILAAKEPVPRTIDYTAAYPLPLEYGSNLVPILSTMSSEFRYRCNRSPSVRHFPTRYQTHLVNLTCGHNCSLWPGP